MSGSLTGMDYAHKGFDMPRDFVIHTDSPHFYKDGLTDESSIEFVNRLLNNLENLILKEGSENIAAMILEPIQGAGGVIIPPENYLDRVQKLLKKNDILLIVDEVICGFGRTGKMFGFEDYNCTPDIVVYGKGLGGGLPIGAFTSNKKVMDSLHKDPIMGHITTFGGNPVVSACAYATLKKISSSKIMSNCIKKEQLLKSLLVHPLIKEIRGKGLMLCLIMENSIIANNLILRAKDNGLLLFWLLINKSAVRITPPLTITNKEIQKGCKIIIDILNKLI